MCPMRGRGCIERSTPRPPMCFPSSADTVRSMHLLVVEDDPRLGRLLVRMLSDERHLVELTASGDEALEIAEAGSGIDAMILDIGLPDLPGTDVARRLRA